MDSCEADVWRVASNDVEAPAQGQGLLVLRDLIALGKVRIEIVLSSEYRYGLNVAPESEGSPNGVVDCLPVEHR
jgi:hypothetical protein